MSEIMYKGQLKGHGGWVTCLATTPVNPNMLISGSRDNNLIIWELTREQNNYGFMKKALVGHNHYVSDVVVSSDGQFALSGSWDKTLRLWELNSATTTRTFNDHTKDVLSVAFSADNRQIVSASRDKTIKLWNTLGECKYTISSLEQGHSDWVSCVRFSPATNNPLIVSSGWDKVVKVWNLQKTTDTFNLKLSSNLLGHNGYINSIAVSPDGSLCASGGKDGIALLWDLKKCEHLYSLDPTGDVINALCFSPNRYWLCAATPQAIKIWNLETKQIIAELVPESKTPNTKPSCLSLAWSHDGTTLFSGYDDNAIRVWQIRS